MCLFDVVQRRKDVTELCLDVILHLLCWVSSSREFLNCVGTSKWLSDHLRANVWAAENVIFKLKTNPGTPQTFVRNLVMSKHMTTSTVNMARFPRVVTIATDGAAKFPHRFMWPIGGVYNDLTTARAEHVFLKNRYPNRATFPHLSKLVLHMQERGANVPDYLLERLVYLRVYETLSTRFEKVEKLKRLTQLHYFSHEVPPAFPGMMKRLGTLTHLTLKVIARRQAHWNIVDIKISDWASRMVFLCLVNVHVGARVQTLDLPVAKTLIMRNVCAQGLKEIRAPLLQFLELNQIFCSVLVVDCCKLVGVRVSHMGHTVDCRDIMKKNTGLRSLTLGPNGVFITKIYADDLMDLKKLKWLTVLDCRKGWRDWDREEDGFGIDKLPLTDVRVRRTHGFTENDAKKLRAIFTDPKRHVFHVM